MGNGEELHTGFPIQAPLQQSCPILTPLFLGNPKLFRGAGRLLELFFGAPERKAEPSPLPSDAFYSPQRERWGSEKGMGADESLGTSSLSPHSDHNPNIPASLQKEKENSYKPK